jgi:hypothetical protein
MITAGSQSPTPLPSIQIAQKYNHEREPKTMILRSVTSLACTAILAISLHAQSAPMPAEQPSTKPLPSPPATASATLKGNAITINYHAPSLRGRKMVGDHDPYGQVWRTGANEATTLITAVNLKIGTLTVPAGTYTIYTLPNADQWLLIVNKQTGQWGTEYNQEQDLGRTPLTNGTLASPQEKMSISFEKTKGNTTELHIKWDKADEYVTVTAE